MSAQLPDMPQAAPERAEPVAILLRQGLGGKWLVEMPAYWTGGTFVGLTEALVFARRECCGVAATIELRFGGMVCVVHQPRGWPKPICVRMTCTARPASPGRRRAPSWSGCAISAASRALAPWISRPTA